MVDKTVLKEIGFTDGEIKVYYALFELGETTVGPISKKSGVTHAKVYPILDKLIQKGLVTYVIKDGRKNYSATNPNSLLEYVNKKVRSLNEEKEKIIEIIPSLLAKQKELEKVQYSRVFEGFRGLRALFYELFSNNKEKTEICVLGLDDVIKEERFVRFFYFYHKIRRENKIELRLILKKNMKYFVDSYYEEKKILSSKDKIKYVNVTFPAGVFIFKDHVITVIEDEKVTAFDIKSRQAAERYRKFFYSIWDKK
jgi:sugar-specific transcriptional regulator TrmB